MPRKKVSGPKTRTTVRLPDEVHRLAKTASSSMGIALQDFVAEATIARCKSLGFQPVKASKGKEA